MAKNDDAEARNGDEAEKSPDEPKTFEQSLQELERVVRELEGGELGLSDALACYEQGMTHLRHCLVALKQAEQRIELLTGLDPLGGPQTEPFHEETMSLEEKQKSRSRRRRPKTQPPPPGDVDGPGTLF